MNRLLGTGFAGLVLLLGGGLMAEKNNKEESPKWVTLKDEETGFEVDFPRRPLDMEFDIPFQNTPPQGKIHLYSVPTQAGVLVFSTLSSDDIQEGWLQEKHLKAFFDKILVPHLFYNPKVFHDHQAFKYTPHEMDGASAAAFEITYRDHGTLKRVEGVSVVREGMLYTYFYLASDEHFDREILKHFVESFHFSSAS